MGEGDGLRPLQVRVAGHDGVRVLLRLGAEDADELRQKLYGVGRQVAQVEPGVQGDLVVAAAGGVELAARVAQALGQDSLDKAVYILRRGVYRQPPLVEVGQDAAESLNERGALRRGDHARLRQHRRVRHAAAYVLPVHPAVHGYGRVEVVRRLVERRVRAPCPELFHAPYPPVFLRGGG